MKQTIITILLALAAMTGLAQVKCHVEGTLETDAWGDEVIICEAGTDLRVVDEPRFHVKAKDGHFTYDIETDFPRLYVVFFLKQYETSSWFEGKFIAENCMELKPPNTNSCSSSNHGGWLALAQAKLASMSATITELTCSTRR